MKKLKTALLVTTLVNCASAARRGDIAHPWPIDLKVEVTKGTVAKGGAPILSVNAEKSDEVSFKVLQRSFAADPAIWKFKVETKAGKSVPISYDTAAKTWVFRREPSKQYVVYVSKRKNSNENLQYLWFEVP